MARRISVRYIQITCPHCYAKFAVGGYTPGAIRCGKCGRAFQLR